MPKKPKKLSRTRPTPPHFTKGELQLIYWGLKDLKTTETGMVERLVKRLTKLGVKADASNLGKLLPDETLLRADFVVVGDKVVKDRWGRGCYPPPSDDAIEGSGEG